MNSKQRFLRKSTVVLLATVLFGNSVATAAPTVTVNPDTEAIINKLFDGEVKVENVKITGKTEQIGTFEGAKNLLGLEDGVVLSTGYASETFKVEGKTPPFFYGYGIEPGSATEERDLPDWTGLEDDYQFDENGPSEEQKTEDKDIEKETGNKNSYDSIALEFDVMPKSDKINLQYVYASNEWQRVFSRPGLAQEGDLGEIVDEFGNYTPDDTAIILVNGKNAATVTDTGAVLSAKNILEASGFDLNAPPPRPEENEFGTQGLFVDSINNRDFGFLGRSVLMSSEADVIPNEINHIKIAVADLGDPVYNTAIFLKLAQGDAIENPKTGDINLFVMTASILGSVIGLGVFANKLRKLKYIG